MIPGNLLSAFLTAKEDNGSSTAQKQGRQPEPSLRLPSYDGIVVPYLFATP